MSDTTYDWIKKIPGSLLEHDELPLLGSPPQFPWDGFIAKLSETFPNNTITVESSEPKWLSEDELFSGLGTPTKFLAMTISSLEGNVYWALAEEELARLMGALLGNAVTDPEYLEGFHHFLALEAINAARKGGFDSHLSVQLMTADEKPSGTQLGFDITITLNGSAFTGRLFINTTLSTSLKNHYYKESEKALYNSELAEKINVLASLEVGSTKLTPKEWSTVSLGDFVILDNCHFKPGDNKGIVMLSYKGKPLFIAKLQEDGTVKLSERSLYNEVKMDNNEHEDEFEDEEFEEEEEDFEEEETSVVEEHEEGEEEAPAEQEEQSAPAEAAVVPTEEKKQAKDPDDIPLNIVVEMARIRLPLKTLMNLQPGNLLELNINPAKNVDLVVNGTRIATGELLQIGESLGVRILEK